MQIIYAQKSTGINEDGSFQNPKYFERPNENATSVIIYGDYPEIEAAYKKLNIHVLVHEVPDKKLKGSPVVVDLNVGITPELQATIDQAKAECEKVVAENDELKQQLEKLKAGLVQDEPADLTGFVPTEQFDAVAIDLANTKEQLVIAQDELFAFKSDVSAMKARIAAIQTDNEASTDPSGWTIEQIKAFLADKNIGFKSSASKPELLALIPKE